MSRHPARGPLLAATALLLASVVVAPAAQALPPAAAASVSSAPALGLQDLEERSLEEAQSLMKELRAAAVRLPLAAALGAVLAWRPRRRGSPKRSPAVVETQVVLAVVGALIMLVVGASLARAFGIVGVASLIRYRSKINDPKDAVVMLCALSVGLASGSGLFALAVFSTLFLFVVLWFVEGFERPTRVFELAVKLGDESMRLRPAVEQVLRRFEIDYELRGASEEGSSYVVTVPNDFSTNRVSRDLSALARDGKGAVEWVEKPKSQVQ